MLCSFHVFRPFLIPSYNSAVVPCAGPACRRAAARLFAGKFRQVLASPGGFRQFGEVRPVAAKRREKSPVRQLDGELGAQQVVLAKFQKTMCDICDVGDGFTTSRRRPRIRARAYHASNEIAPQRRFCIVAREYHTSNIIAPRRRLRIIARAYHVSEKFRVGVAVVAMERARTVGLTLPP